MILRKKYGMKKILLILKTSNGELYRKTTQVQLDMYRKWQEKTPMNIDVLAVTAGDETRQEGDFLYVKCDDKDLFTKHCIGVGDYIKEHPEYDVVININTCTAINLEFIYRFVNNEFNMDNNNNLAYGHGFVRIMWDFYFLPGTFIMCSRDMFMNHLYDHDMAVRARDIIARNVYHSADRLNDTETTWEGVAEDAVWGLMSKWQHVALARINCISTRENIRRYDGSYRDGTQYYDSNLEHLNTSPVFDLHLDIPYNERVIVEPMMLKMAIMYWMGHPMTDDEYHKEIY